MFKNKLSLGDWYRIRNVVVRVWNMIPFLGHLDYSNGSAWRKAFIETALSIALSSVPLWVAVYALYWMDLEPTVKLASQYVVRNGELMILAASAVSPLIYMTSVAYRQRDMKKWVTSFPHGAFYLLFSILILCACVTYIALRTTAGHPAGLGKPFNPRNFDSLSWQLYLASLFLFFTASVHRNTIDSDDPSVKGKASEDKFSNEWKTRGG